MPTGAHEHPPSIWLSGFPSQLLSSGEVQSRGPAWTSPAQAPQVPFGRQTWAPAWHGPIADGGTLQGLDRDVAGRIDSGSHSRAQESSTPVLSSRNTPLFGIPSQSLSLPPQRFTVCSGVGASWTVRVCLGIPVDDQRSAMVPPPA